LTLKLSPDNKATILKYYIQRVPKKKTTRHNTTSAISLIPFLVLVVAHVHPHHLAGIFPLRRHKIEIGGHLSTFRRPHRVSVVLRAGQGERATIVGRQRGAARSLQAPRVAWGRLRRHAGRPALRSGRIGTGPALGRRPAVAVLRMLLHDHVIAPRVDRVESVVCVGRVVFPRRVWDQVILKSEVTVSRRGLLMT